MDWVTFAFSLLVVLGAGLALEYARRFRTILSLTRYSPTMCELATRPALFWLNVTGWGLIFLMGLAGVASSVARALGWIAP